MLVFFIHGVNTQNSRYADELIKKIRKKLATPANFYSSFWGNLFNNKKHQTIGCIEKDFSRVCEHHKEYKGSYDDIYRYKKRRNDIISNFLIYQNPDRGKAIRKTIVVQLSQFLNDHSNQQEIHLIAHSLGSFILWDLIFSNTLDNDDPAFIFREKLNLLNLASITTLGSPLLFLKQMLDIDFSVINYYFKNSNKEETAGLQKLRWVNIIHSSDLIAYPLKAAIENEIGLDLLFCDQYVWQYANAMEKTLKNMGQSDMAMVVGAEDAHSSYFYDNLDGDITSDIIASNLLGKTQKLLERCVHQRPMA